MYTARVSSRARLRLGVGVAVVGIGLITRVRVIPLIVTPGCLRRHIGSGLEEVFVSGLGLGGSGLGGLGLGLEEN